jgi:L-lactate permease
MWGGNTAKILGAVVVMVFGLFLLSKNKGKEIIPNPSKNVEHQKLRQERHKPQRVSPARLS